MTPWLITAATVLTILALNRWENSYLKSIFEWVPAILLAYVFPALLSWILGRDYADSEIHQFSRNWLIPLTIITVMSTLSLLQLRAMGWKPVIVFMMGSCWIAMIPVVPLWWFQDSAFVQHLFLADAFWKGIPPIVGSWIGGSTSQLVLKELVDCPEGVFLSILILDNVLVNIWTILMFQGIKRSDWINRTLGIADQSQPADLPSDKSLTLPLIWCMLLLVLLMLLVNVLTTSFVLRVILLSILGLVTGNAVAKWNYEAVLQVGGVLILTVMAILGLRLKFELVRFDPGLIIFLVIWLTSHFVIMLFAAKLLRVHSAWVPIASMANVGGIATAPAVTAAYRKAWMPHAILLAILSMATGTFWGMLTIYLLRQVLGM